jgi:hypothetical protein
VAVISNATTIADAGAFSVNLGSMVLIKTLTASSSGTLSFVNGASGVVLDNTYPTYMFKFINIHPATDNTTFTFNLSVDGGSNYNVAKTTTNIRAFHDEGDSSTELDYLDGLDLAQGTGVQALVENIGNGNDESVSGLLHLFEPSSTTFVKHLIWEVPSYGSSNAMNIQYGAGYGNTTTAVNAIQFAMGSGNIDSGQIKLYGIAS